jgi:Inner membrane component of T3SS, cytoplasmic domain
VTGRLIDDAHGAHDGHHEGRSGASGWVINDPVIRFRVVGSECVFDLTTADRWVLGSSPECSLHLDDPSGRVSRQHAAAVREGELWTLQDLDSTNGIRVNGEGRISFQLVPGDEIAIGGITLLAESHRSIELHALLQRWLGWSMSCLGNVDRALCAVREMANLRAALFLNGAGPLVGVARRLHRLTLGDRPFVSLGRSECGEQELDRARGAGRKLSRLSARRFGMAARQRERDPRRDRRRRPPAGRAPKLGCDRGSEADWNHARRALSLGTSTEDFDLATMATARGTSRR